MEREMDIKNKELKRRLIEISYKNKLSHLGSVLTAVDIIDEIYSTKKSDEPFILSSGHAGLALYTVIEKYEGVDAESIFNHHEVHPDRCSQCHIYCSTGSLGQGLPIAVGMALANRKKNVYCLISDGEMAEGSVYEAMNVMKREHVGNLKLYVNWNGWTAYGKAGYPVLDMNNLPIADGNFKKTSAEQFPFLKGLDAHYYTMKEEDYKQAMEILR